jgi:hypothetical protein
VLSYEQLFMPQKKHSLRVLNLAVDYTPTAEYKL